MNATLILRFGLLLVLTACSGICAAGIEVGGTRVIFPATDREASIQVRNQGSEDTMIQSWIEGAPNQAESEVPFAITPSLARLSYKKQQMLRIFYQGKGLPTDRESVFWLNIQEIPQLSEQDNSLQIAFRQRLKLFYRPAKLPGTPDEAAKNLKWDFVSRPGESMLLASNASAFYVSLGSVTLLVGGKEYPAGVEMVGPDNSAKMKVTGAPENLRGSAKVQWESINDYGSLVKHHADIQL